MNHASRSVKTFGIYLIILGLTLFAVPNLIQALLRLSDVPAVWLRFIGELLAFIGLYYMLAAKKDWMDFFILSAWLRFLVFISVASFVFLKQMPVLFFPLSLIDLSGGLWTLWAVQGDRK